MVKQLIRGAVVAAFCAGAMLAQAGTVNLTGWTYGSGGAVDVSTPAYNGQGGGFTGTLSGFGAPFDSNSFQTYCVELTQQFNFGASMSDYSIIAGAANTEWNLYGGNAATTSARLGQLMTYVNTTGAVTNASQSTSLQLAIWNIIYDTDNTLLGGSFKMLSGINSNPGFTLASYANTLLSDSLNTVSNLNVYVLKSPTNQDFLITTAVPEPSTYALLLAGLAGVGFITRRRRAQT